MVMGRRHRKARLRRLRDALWPRTGVRRAAKYIAYRLARLPGTPYSIAAGFAAGAAVSFTPLMGLHFILGALLALATGGNLIASLIGTAVGNPWTFPLIWSLIYTVGRAVLGMSAGEGVSADLTLSQVIEQPWEFLYPMLVGAVPAALTAWTLFFFPVYFGVRRYQAIRRARRHRKMGERASRTRASLPAVEGERG